MSDVSKEDLIEAANALFKQAYRLKEGLTVDEVTEDSVPVWRKDLDFAEAVIMDAMGHLRKVRQVVELASMRHWESRSRLYVVRRETKNAGKPLTWTEIQATSSEGPWCHSLSIREVCIRDRDRRNAMENGESKVRGHKPGAYVWQVWGYEAQADVWTRED